MKVKKICLKYDFLLIAVLLLGLCTGRYLTVFFYQQAVPPAVYGDANGDHIVNAQDGDWLYRYLTEHSPDVEMNTEMRQYDFNQDSIIDYADVQYYYAYCNTYASHQLSFKGFVEKINRKEIGFYEET